MAADIVCAWVVMMLAPPADLCTRLVFDEDRCARSGQFLLDRAGLAGVRVADGKAEIVIQPIQELVVVPGIKVAGPLPDELQDTVTYQAVIIPNAKEREPLNALISYLRTPDATAVINAMGMGPG